MGTNNRPDEKGDTSNGNEIGLYGEQVTDLVDGEPDSGQRTEPEDEEAGKVARIGTGAGGHRIGDVIVRGPD